MILKGCNFRLALLWYHTIIRPFFALDDRQDAGEFSVCHCLVLCDINMIIVLHQYDIDDVMLTCMLTGVPEASTILLKAEKDYPDSAIFQYFRGRVLSLQVCYIAILYDILSIVLYVLS